MNASIKRWVFGGHQQIISRPPKAWLPTTVNGLQNALAVKLVVIIYAYRGPKLN